MICDVEQMAQLAFNKVSDANGRLARDESEEDRELALFAVTHLRQMIGNLKNEYYRLWGR